MINLDRRMLIVGHWGPDGTTPNHSRVQGLATRLKKAFGPEGNYPFKSMAGKNDGPDVLYNAKDAELTAKIGDDPEDVSDQTLFFLYYIGHAVGADDDDLRIRLRYKSKDQIQVNKNLSTLLGQIRDAGFKKLILVLDCCHAGRTLKLYENFPTETFAMLATGKSYAFNCDFSEALLATLERGPSKRDQRIDRTRKGFTYERLFQGARAPFVLRDMKEEERPQRFDGGLEHELLAAAPVIITKGFNPLISRRTVYGRVHACLELLAEAECLRLEFPARLKTKREFLLQNNEDGEDRYVKPQKALEYCDFLVDSKLADLNASRVSISAIGREALNGSYNKVLLDQIASEVMPLGVSLEHLDEAIEALIGDMIPPTPAMISERLLNRGIHMELTPSLRIALLLLPSTGRFLKSSSDALFPSEPELAVTE